MSGPLPQPTVRRAVVPGPDAGVVGRLVEAYLRQTELEKAAHLSSPALQHQDGQLPAAYRAEVEDPGTAYAGASAHVAELSGEVVGVAVARTTDTGTEVKRLWADPLVRGRGVGAALIDAVLRESRGVVRLSVWDWRVPAIGLYESRGFVVVPSWDTRPRLVCLERSDLGRV